MAPAHLLGSLEGFERQWLGRGPIYTAWLPAALIRSTVQYKAPVPRALRLWANSTSTGYMFFATKKKKLNH
jgi:hypothetical protein